MPLHRTQPGGAREKTGMAAIVPDRPGIQNRHDRAGAVRPCPDCKNDGVAETGSRFNLPEHRADVAAARLAAPAMEPARQTGRCKGRQRRVPPEADLRRGKTGWRRHFAQILLDPCPDVGIPLADR